MREPPGLREFLAARSPALLRTATLLTGDRHAAEDLLQAVLSELWPRWQRVASQGDPEAYIRRALVNRNISRWRRRRPVEVPLEDDPAALVRADDSDDVARQRDLARALRALTPRQRAVVVLRFYDDLSEAQAAAVLGCSVGTVKSQTHKALARLRDSGHLTDHEPQGATR